MPRKRGRVEIGVTAGILAVVLVGCAGAPERHPWDHGPWDPTRPDGLDHNRAVRCAGLLDAFREVDAKHTLSPDLESLARLYDLWAYGIALQNGQDASKGRENREAVTLGILGTVIEVRPSYKLGALQWLNAQEVDACTSVAKRPADDSPFQVVEDPLP